MSNDNSQLVRHELDLMDIADAVRQRKVVFLATVVGFVTSFLLVAFWMTPTFRTAVVVVDAPELAGTSLGPLGGTAAGLARFAGLDLAGADGSSAYARAVLRSRGLVEEFIRRNGLLPILFSGDWDAATGSWNVPSADQPTIWEATELFTKDILKVRDDPRSGGLTVVVDWSDPVVAADWATGLVDLANTLIRDRDVHLAKSNLDYLNAQIAKTPVLAMQDTLYSLVKNELRTLVLANGRQEYAFVIVDGAFVPEEPAFPSFGLMGLVGFVIGAVVGVVCVVVLHLRGRTDRRAISP